MKSESNIIVQTLRIIVGILVAPMIPALLFAIPNIMHPNSVGISFYLGIAAIAGYPVILIFGIPLYRLFLLGRTNSFLPCIYLGATLGGLAYLMTFIFGLVSGDPSSFYAMKTTIKLLPVSIFCGGLAGISFWFVALTGRSL